MSSENNLPNTISQTPTSRPPLRAAFSGLFNGTSAQTSYSKLEDQDLDISEYASNDDDLYVSDGEDDAAAADINGVKGVTQSLSSQQIATLRLVPSISDLTDTTHIKLSSRPDSLIPSDLSHVNPVPPVAPTQNTDFLDIVQSVKDAITQGVYPTRISQGSSGSYFCKNSRGEIVGVFKPKNEEPYGHLNPKWTKWIHKNLFPCCFGRSCLIPNLGYISEAAASYLDRRLQLNVCPRTEIVELASPSFFYSLKDRRAHRRGVPLPPKMGSFQLFLKGYKDATTFFKEGYDKVAAAETASDNYNSRSSSFEAAPSRRSASHPLNWPEKTKKDFQMGFERLVVLDYLTRNTDRGSDNWMIRYNPQIVAKYNHASAARPTSMSSEGTVVDMSKFINNAGGGGTSGQGCDASLTSTTTPLLLSDSIDKNMATLSAGEEIQHHLLPYHHESSSSSTLTPSDFNISKNTPSSNPVSYSPSAESLLSVDYNNIEVTIHVSAIDNGLAFPYKHPDRWRSYPYGWSALPISRLPFSSSTRKQVLHLLTSQEWWNETRAGLEKLFRLDPDFNDAMWRKQRAIIRGQGYNLVEALRRSECNDAVTGSPFGLLQRPVVAVYDDDFDEDGTGGNFLERSRQRMRSAALRFENFSRKQPCFSWC